MNSKKSYSLVLGWWAAKWFCHIWVLQYIEEKKIPISEICGTSMGAIIWSAIALWKTSTEIERFISQIHIFTLIDFSVTSMSLKWNKIMKKIEEFLGDSSFDDTQIPLKIIATNLATGKIKVFSTGKILPAIRASFSIPWIFSLATINDIQYADWGLSEHLPISEATNRSIIAVSAITEKSPSPKEQSFIWNFLTRTFLLFKVIALLDQVSLSLLKSNEEFSCQLALLQGKDITLLTPDISAYGFHDYHKVKEISEIWYNEATKKLSLI